MDIRVGDIWPVKNDLSGESTTTLTRKRFVPKDRRKNKQDRRKSIREGVLVSLSTKNNRRVTRDRRRTGA